MAQFREGCLGNEHLISDIIRRGLLRSGSHLREMSCRFAQVRLGALGEGAGHPDCQGLMWVESPSQRSSLEELIILRWQGLICDYVSSGRPFIPD